MNQYLEKIAANRHKQYMQAKGMNFDGITNQSIRAAYGHGDMTGTYNAGDGKLGRKGGFMGIGSKVDPTKKTYTGATKVTGDSFAAGPNLQQRLKAHRTGKAQAAAAEAAKPLSEKARGLVSKALSFAKANPLKAAGGVLAAGVAGKMMLGNSQPQYQSYNQY